VDFTPFIDLPPVPGAMTVFLGAALGSLANLPIALNIFDRLGKRAIKKMLKKNPV